MASGSVLVTGAGGCIAAWVMKDLTDANVPVVGFDISDNKRRARLAMADDAVERIAWETGDIADGDRLRAVADKHRVEAIIHLAALQVPFCKADPVAGAKVNVLGTVNVLETARSSGHQAPDLCQFDSHPGDAGGQSLAGYACMEPTRHAARPWRGSIGRIGVLRASGFDQGWFTDLLATRA